MASTVSKKRGRSTRASRRQRTPKSTSLDAAQIKESMKQAVREVLEEARADEQDEQEWTRQFGNSQDALDKIAERVREQIRAGKTEPLDPDQL